MTEERAETYTHGHPESVLRSHRWRTVENSAGYVIPHLRPGIALLDVGCGPGTITADFAARVAPGAVLGIDASAGVIAQATADAAGTPGLRYAVDDVYALEVPDGSYDVVHAHQVLQHLADPVAALREMRRVVRPGGVVAARDAVYRAMCWYPANPGLERWLEVYCAVAEANGGEPDAGSHLQAWATEAGFTRTECSATAWCFATPEDRAWWGTTWAERIAGTQLGDRAVELGICEPGEPAALADSWRSWVAAPDAWFAVLHGELLASG